MTIRCLVLVSVLVGTAQADTPPPAIDDAIKSAATAKQPLVIEFGAAWCGPCKLFEQNVLPDASVQTALKGVTFVRYDVDVSPGSEAAQRFGIEAYPTFLVVDRKGTEVARRRGMLDVAGFLELIDMAPNNVLDETDIQAALRAHPNDPLEHLRAARWFAKQRRAPEAISHYTAVLKARNVGAGDRDEALRACEHLKRIDVWHHDLVADKLAAAKAAPLTVPLDDLAIATIDSVAPPKDVKALLGTVLAAQTATQRTNGMIYIALAAGAADEALVAAKRVLAPTQDPQFLDTLAECFHMAGDRDQAIATEDEALKLAKGGGFEATLKHNRARFDAATSAALIKVADEVTTARARVAETWRRLETADQLAQPPAPNAFGAMSPAAAASTAKFRKIFDATRALGIAAAKTCTKDVGASKLAMASLTVDAAGKITVTTLLLDEKASQKLRACLTKELAAATLPPDAIGQQMIRIDLKP